MKNLFVLLVFLFCGTMMTNAQNDIQRPSSYNYTKGIDLAHEGKTSEALECFEKELKDNPKNGYAYSWIGAIYLKMEEYGSALTAIRNSIKYLPAKDEDFVANSYKALCNVYLNVQDTLQAYSTLGEGLRAYRNNGELLETRAQLYFEQSKYEESNIDYQHMIDVNPGDEMGYMGVGRNLKMQKKYSEAIALFDKVKKLSPNYSSGYAFWTECLFAQKKYEAAIDDVIKALSIDINDRKALHHLMELSDSVFDDVISHLKVQTIKEKKTVNWYYCLGIVCIHSNYYQEAINTWRLDEEPLRKKLINIVKKTAKDHTRKYYQFIDWNHPFSFVPEISSGLPIICNELQKRSAPMVNYNLTSDTKEDKIIRYLFSDRPHFKEEIDGIRAKLNNGNEIIATQSTHMASKICMFQFLPMDEKVLENLVDLRVSETLY